MKGSVLSLDNLLQDQRIEQLHTHVLHLLVQVGDAVTVGRTVVVVGWAMLWQRWEVCGAKMFTSEPSPILFKANEWRNSADQAASR